MVEALYAPNGSYEAAEDRKLIRSIFRADGNGGVISGMQVIPGQGLQVVITPGFFVINDSEGGAFLGYITTSQTVSIDANTSGTTRSDTVYATVNPTTGAVTFNKATGSSVIPANSTQLGRANVPSGAQSLASSAIVNNPTPVSLGGHADARYLRRDLADVLFAGTTVAQAPTVDGSALQVATKGYVDNKTGFLPLSGYSGVQGSSVYHGPIDPAPAGGLGTKFLIKAGSVINVSDLSGYNRIEFDTPFPNALLTCVITNGDDVAAQDTTMNIAGGGAHTAPAHPWGVGNRSLVVYKTWGPAGTSPYTRVILQQHRHRANYIAIGW